MTNNLEDFEQPEPGQGGLPPAQTTRAKLAHAWRTRPLFKLLVIMVVAGALIAVGISLFSSPPPTEMTKLVQPPRGMHEAPGGSASPYFVEQTKKAEAERESTAIKTGGSALPTPLGANTGIEDLTKNQAPRTDPLVELRSQIEHQKQQIEQMKQQQAQPVQQPQRPPEQFDNSLAQAMQKQMQQMMSSWEPKGIKQISNNIQNDNKKSGNGTGESADQQASAAVQNASGAQPRTVVPAGTVSYAQLLTEANSDVPGPILAQIVSGPLSGARAIGAFQVMDDYLVLKFTLANLKGKDYGINAIALDPDTTLGGMATEVDQRYFTRVVLPAAAGFMQGFGQALGQGSSSIVTNGDTTIVQQSGQGLQQGMFQGLAQAGQTLGQFFQSQANKTQPLVRVAAGTPMGLFFVSSVTDNNPLAQSYPFRSGVAGSGYQPGYGYPTGYGPAGTNYAATQGNGYYYPGAGASGYYGQTPVSGSNTGAGNVPYPYANQPYNPTIPPVSSNRYMPGGSYPGYYGYGYTGATP